MGTFIVKNNNIQNNQERYDDIEKAIATFKNQMVEDFSRDVRDISDKLEDDLTVKDKKELNKYIRENNEKYVDLYQSALADYDFEVKFINH